MEQINRNGQYLRGEGDGRTMPIFFIHAEPDPIASEKEGRPMFREVEKVKLHFAGNPYSVPVVDVDDTIRAQFKVQYDAFKKTGDMAIVGTPLKEWASLSVSRIAELNALNIWSVEAIANLDDLGIQRLGMGSRELVAKAKAYLDSAKGNSPIEQLATENVHQAEEIALLKKTVSELKAGLDALTEPEKKSRKAN